MADPLPGKGFFGWLGRQVGHVKKAAKADVGAKKVYEQKKIEQQPHPENPNIVLRRTTIDEVIERNDER
jgi:hypothetical protein